MDSVNVQIYKIDIIGKLIFVKKNILILIGALPAFLPTLL
jgi:hypothetical protein